MVAACDGPHLRHSDLVFDSETSVKTAPALFFPSFTRGRVTFIKAEVVKVNLNAVLSGKVSIKTYFWIKYTGWRHKKPLKEAPFLLTFKTIKGKADR